MRCQSGVVVVIAEGLSSKWQECRHTDAGDVGVWFRRQLQEFLDKQETPSRVHYIDPSYMIRSTPPDPVDSIFCTALAQNAVHASMAGYTAFSVGKVNNRYVLLPIQELVSRGRQSVSTKGSWFARLMCTTGQPATAAGVPREQPQATGERQRKRGRNVAASAFGLQVVRFLRKHMCAPGVSELSPVRNQHAQSRLTGFSKPRHGMFLSSRAIFMA
eukprot:TRINITY_DN29461_c0_g2_i1.p1 TRINITY_DN29461_c0_g2~~TRINITY_DN29461_c0_g2_i1.p1  ORF type:complete len:252 (-),score=17.40 TRINITY_DN29461_c0_g2_i1:261-908(-)